MGLTRRPAVLPVALALVFAACSRPAPQESEQRLGAGVEPQDVLDVQQYTISLDPHFSTKTVTLAVTVDAVTLRATNELLLHFTGPDPNKVEVDRKARPITRDGDRIRIPLAGDLPSRRRVRIDVAYEGAPGRGMTFGELVDPDGHKYPSLHTDEWPDWARSWLPCVDHPIDRARVRLQIGRPADSGEPQFSNLELQAVANGLPLGGAASAGRWWEEQTPIPTYLIAVAIGPYAVPKSQTSSAPQLLPHRGHPWAFQNWAYRWDSEKARVDFGTTDEIVEFFESRFTPYPYEKVAFVQVATRFGGMENAGCIFIQQGAVDGSGRNRDTLAHELAHQWFGDWVGIADWRDVWLSEGFASYFGTVYMAEGRKSAELSALMGETQDRLRALPLVRERAILAPLPKNLDEILNDVTYAKGSCVLHALRRYVGNDAFWRGIKRHLDRNGGRAVRTADFATAFAEGAGTGASTVGFIEAWTQQTGFPIFQVSKPAGIAGNRIRFTIEQVQAGGTFPCAFDAVEIGGAAPKTHAIRFDGNRSVTVETENLEATDLRLDPDHWVLFERR
jgi:aminopeptidase N